MRRLIARRESLVIPLLVGLGVSVPIRDAKADLFGGDLPLLAGILTQAVATVSNLVTMVNSIRTQITMMQRMLSRLDINSFSDVLNLIRTSQAAYRMLTTDVHNIEYTMAGVNRAYRKIFPSDVSTNKTTEFKPMAKTWHQETLDAAFVAQRAQTSLSTMDNNTAQAAAILSRSGTADGEVAQLQAVNQMLGIISSQLNTVISALDTTGRVTADMAASNAAEHITTFEEQDRTLENYTDRGPGVPVMSKMPDPY